MGHYKILETNSNKEHIIRQHRVILGRSNDCDVTLEHASVSKRHAKLEYNPNDNCWFITDLGSRNGTFLNDTQLKPLQSQKLRLKDNLKLCDLGLAFKYIDAPVPPGPSKKKKGSGLPDPHHSTRVEVKDELLEVRAGQPIKIGRSTDNDIAIPSPVVSRHHAKIETQGNCSIIYDLNSTHGVYVNGHRIKGKQQLQLLDVIHIGDAKLVFNGVNKAIKTFDENNSVRMDAIGISKQAQDGKVLLNDISFTILPGEFVTILGGSGAGKSTTLDALNGFRPASGGQILVNGDDYYRNFNSYRSILGYVPQSDIIHDELTVEESLNYVAKLRLSNDISEQERRRLVHDVMQKMGLETRADVTVKDLSGGQKKRVSIGVELLSEPSLFFLDEPTSGLDPGTERKMMQLLRDLADQGKTVFLITHAVGNLDYCDLILFLARGGSVAYYGPPQDMLTYFKVQNIADIYNKLDENPEHWIQAFKRSKYYGEYVVKRSQDVSPPPATPNHQKEKIKASYLQQFFIYTQRYAHLLSKKPLSLLVQLLQAPLIAFLMMLAFDLEVFSSSDFEMSRLSPSVLFMLACISIWFGTSNCAQEIIKEIHIYKRERMVNLKILPYMLSKITVMGLITVVQCLVMALIVNWAFKIDQAYWAEIFASLSLSALTGVMMGLAISAIVKSREMAVVLVPLILIPQIMFSGAIFKISDMTEAGQSVSYLTASRWTYQALGNVTERNQKITPPPGATSDKFDSLFDEDKEQSWTVLLSMMVMLFLVILGAMKLKDKK